MFRQAGQSIGCDDMFAAVAAVVRIAVLYWRAIKTDASCLGCRSSCLAISLRFASSRRASRLRLQRFGSCRRLFSSEPFSLACSAVLLHHLMHLFRRALLSKLRAYARDLSVAPMSAVFRRRSHPANCQSPPTLSSRVWSTEKGCLSRCQCVFQSFNRHRRRRCYR